MVRLTEFPIVASREAFRPFIFREHAPEPVVGAPVIRVDRFQVVHGSLLKCGEPEGKAESTITDLSGDLSLIVKND